MGLGRNWSDEDLRTVAENPDMTSQELGVLLGRSTTSIHQVRSKMRTGRPLGTEGYAREELEFIRATPSLTARQQAEYLGRPYGSAIGMRKIVRERFGVNFAFQKDPNVIGGRHLLAKTCLDCGLLLDARWFRMERKTRARQEWRSICTLCTSGRQNGKRAPREYKGQPWSEFLQAKSLQTASKNREPWTEQDYRVLQDPDLTDFEKAVQLNRTFYATENRVNALGYKSKTIKSILGSKQDGQWVIGFKEVS
jgi:hypothetical protein